MCRPQSRRFRSGRARGARLRAQALRRRGGKFGQIPRQNGVYRAIFAPSISVNLRQRDPVGQILVIVQKQQQHRQRSQNAADAQHAHVLPFHLGQEHRQRVVVGAVQVNQRLFHHVPGVHKGQDDQRDHPRPAAGQQDAEQNRKVARAVDAGGVQHIVGAGVEHLPQQKHAEGRKDGGDDQRGPGPHKPQRTDHKIVGDQRDLVGHHHDDDDDKEQRLPPGEAELGKRIPGQAGNQRLPGHDGRAQKQRVPELDEVVRAADQHLEPAVQRPLLRPEPERRAGGEGIDQGEQNRHHHKQAEEAEEHQPQAGESFGFHLGAPFLTAPAGL